MEGIPEKIMATKAANGTLHVWKGKRGGNGQLTEPQKTLLRELQRLNPLWEPELPITTKMPRGSGYPTAYKVDIGLKAAKVAVEIDGKGHSTQRAKKRDAKKQEFLKGLGWTVLRFTNKQALERPKATAKIILSSTVLK
jgi:hypothetical protein